MSRYFSRVIAALPVTETRYYDAFAVEVPRRPVRTEHEVPLEYLIVPRTEEERREALLCYFATFRRDFWAALPAACRRDHRPPPATGGSGNRNRVRAGVAAAMILAEQALAQPGDEALPGADLFTKVTARMREMLKRLGERGRLAVDPTGLRLPVREPIIILPPDELVGGRAASCIRPPLFEIRATQPKPVKEQ